MIAGIGGGSGKRFHEPGQITRIVDMAVDIQIIPSDPQEGALCADFSGHPGQGATTEGETGARFLRVDFGQLHGNGSKPALIQVHDCPCAGSCDYQMLSGIIDFIAAMSEAIERRGPGADAELFAAEVVDGVVHLTMAKGCTYSTRTTYKVTPVLTFCGQEVTGSTLSIRVTQSTVKLAKLSNRTVYQSQTAPLVQVLSITSPATAEFGEITLNSRSTAALRNAVEAAGGIEVSGGTVRFPAKAFASLKPGRYTVILDVTPENAAADAKPIQARFTLTVQK